MDSIERNGSGGRPSGLERITALEWQTKALREDTQELKEDMKDVKDLLLQGRGAMRVAHVIMVALGYLGVDQVGRPIVAALLKKLGQ